MARVKGDPEHPANFGDICAKAVHLPPVLRTPDRLLYPQLRTRRDARARAGAVGDGARASPPSGCARSSPRHGPDAVAFYGSGQLLTEEYYVASKLAKGFLGTNNFDTNSRLCMASAAVGYARSLGADGPPARLRGPRARRLLLPDRHQHRRLPSHRLQAHQASGSSRRPTRSRSSWPTRAGPRRPTSPICTCRSGPARTSRCSTRMLHVLWKDGLLDAALRRRAHDAAGTRCAR